MAEDVEEVLAAEHLGRVLAAIGELARLALELPHGRSAGTARRLVRAHDHALDPHGAVQRRDRHERDDGAAVGVGDDARCSQRIELVRIHLGHHEGDPFVHAEGARVVDDPRSGPHGRGRQRLAHALAGAEERHVHAFEGLRRRLMHHALARSASHGGSRAARAGEEPQLAATQAAALDELKELDAHRTGGADDRDHWVTGHTRVLPRPGPPTADHSGEPTR